MHFVQPMAVRQTTQTYRIRFCILCLQGILHIYVDMHIYIYIIYCNWSDIMCTCVYLYQFYPLNSSCFRAAVSGASWRGCRWVAFRAAAWAPASAVSIQSNVQLACSLKWVIPSGSWWFVGKNCDFMGFNHYNKWWFDGDLPSGKHTKSYWKWP